MSYVGLNWNMLACVDRLVEIGELVEIPNPISQAGQHRIFIARGEGEGVIAASSLLFGPSATLHLLQSRRQDIAERFRPIAEQHRKETSHKVRLVRFTRAEDIEDLP